MTKKENQRLVQLINKKVNEELIKKIPNLSLEKIKLDISITIKPTK